MTVGGSVEDASGHIEYPASEARDRFAAPRMHRIGDRVVRDILETAATPEARGYGSG